MDNKGQWFIVMSIFIIIILALLKTNLNMLDILEKKRALEQGFERQEFQNFRDEILKASKLSIFKSQNISSDVNNFMKSARVVFSAESIKLNGLLIEAVFPKVTAGTDTRINVTVLNLLKKEVIELNITFNGTSLNFTNVVDAATIETNFTFNIDTSYNYTLSVFYKVANENRTENIIIPVEIGKSKFIGFFDIRMISDRVEQRDRFAEILTLP